jgi:hypothetical protein
MQKLERQVDIAHKQLSFRHADAEIEQYSVLGETNNSGGQQLVRLAPKLAKRRARATAI